jgi:CRP/FNR family transcriptional regulator, cyclic AMP receptor protein
MVMPIDRPGAADYGRRMFGGRHTVTPLDVLPEVAEALAPERERQLRRHLVVEALTVDLGPWDPAADLGEPPYLGVLVFEGLLGREVSVDGSSVMELLGPGDLLRPLNRDGGDFPAVRCGIEWTIFEQARLALLDRRATVVLAAFPEAIAALLGRTVGRSQALALHLAISHLRTIDSRLLALFWHLADRWGRVSRDGVRVPVKLTHQSLARLVGAQRPSITTALSKLSARSALIRQPNGTWLLGEPPPDELADETRDNLAMLITSPAHRNGASAGAAGKTVPAAAV